MKRLTRVVFSTLFIANMAHAEQADKWTFPIYEHTPVRASGVTHTDLPTLSTFESLAPAQVKEKHFMCLLLPQTQDSVFTSYIYGAVNEAQRLGQTLTVFDAGGYGNNSNQHAQFENCLTLGADAILLEAVSPDGWAEDLANAEARGVKVINATESIDASPAGRSLVDYRLNGRLAAQYIVKQNPKARVLVLPGAAGIPFVEDTIEGFKDTAKGAEVKITNVVYGDMDATAQLKLVEDALVADPDIDYIFGNAVAIKQAVNVLAQRNMTGKIKLVSSYIDPDVVALINKGTVEAATAESSVMLKRIAVNLAISAIEGTGPTRDVVPAVQFVSKDNVNSPDIAGANFPPAGWKVTFKTN